MDRRALALTACLWATAGLVYGAPPPHLVILTPTGQIRDGLPVLTRHPDASSVGRILTRGFSGHLLRLYAWEQAFLRQRTGTAPEPAYLLLSDHQGGFPRFGFCLDGVRKPGVGWVDLHRSSRLSGSFGAMDQIFPHELLHVIVRQLAGPPRESGGNQVHAIGVRTDPVNAFSEGFAEHVQILAVDDPDAASDTQALRQDATRRTRAEREPADYARQLASRWLPVRPQQLRFLLWFSQSEQVLRYHAVRANLFAHAAVIPPTLLSRHDLYDAYLVQSVLPGRATDPPKPVGTMLSTEGVVSHLFWQLVTCPTIQQRYRAEDFYAQFGTSARAVEPIENVFLKLFVALFAARPADAGTLLRAYVREFPEDALDVGRITRDTLLGAELPDVPEVWLASRALMTGTSLFDQYRGLPRRHTFDANAATELDWLTVPGVDRTLARTLMAGVPYSGVEALNATRGLPVAIQSQLRSMSDDMAALLTRAAEEEDSLNLWALARPYLYRFGALLLVAALLGGTLARRAGVAHVWTAALMGLAAASVVLSLAWIITCPPWYPLVGSIALGGVPWALWRLARKRSLSGAVQALSAWALASAPAIVVSGLWL
jgi:hypothetical protein